MKLILLIVIVSGFVCACSPKDPAELSTSPGNIDSLFKEYYNFKKRINPLEATKSGFSDYNAQLANYISDPYKEDLVKNYARFQKELARYDSAKLTPSQWLSLGVMEWDCKIKIEGLNNALVTVASPMYDMPSFELFPLI